MSSADRSHYPVRIRPLRDDTPDDATAQLSPSERVAMVWELTRQAWTFKEGRWVEPRLRRDVVRIVRSGVEFLVVGAQPQDLADVARLEAQQA